MITARVLSREKDRQYPIRLQYYEGTIIKAIAYLVTLANSNFETGKLQSYLACNALSPLYLKHVRNWCTILNSIAPEQRNFSLKHFI